MTEEKGIAGERILTGAIAGIVGTWGMTLAMRQMFRRLPARDRYPLPPREITETVLVSGRRDRPPDRTVSTRTLAAHFGYGAACGSLFTASGMHRRHPIIRGAVYGVGIWAVSYLGIMPALRILVPATRHPARRNALMIAAHVVWGAGLGLVSGTLQPSVEPFENRRGKRLPDIMRR